MTQAEKAQRLINSHRRQKGLKILRRSQELQDSALEHAANMAANDFFDHRNFKNRHPKSFTSAAEVIYWTTWEPNSQIGAVKGWMESPGHRDILMNPKYTHIGLSRVYDRASGKIFWVGMVGRG